MKIYVDSEHRCHTTNPECIFEEVETNFFDGKCATFIEGYCCEVDENSISIYPWKDYAELDNAQREHEKQLLAEYAEALKVVGVTV